MCGFWNQGRVRSNSPKILFKSKKMREILTLLVAITGMTLSAVITLWISPEQEWPYIVITIVLSAMYIAEVIEDNKKSKE